MTNRSADDLNWLTDLPPGPRQRWLSWGLMLILIGVSILAAPFSSTTLMERPAFVPMIGVAIFLCDLIAASLFFNYYHIYRSDILSILGCSHLFTASMVIIRVLSFPGGLTTHGVVGGSDQTPAWLYLFWHASFPIALLCYASVQDRQRRSALPLVACIGLAALAVVIAAWGATHLTAALPMVTTRNNQPTVFARAILVGEMIICAVGAAKLQRRRRSLLDQWLTVMASASILELIFAGMLGGGQFSVGFYFGRMLAGCTSAIILVLLLSEAAHVYARLARANVQLRREQSNRLLTLEAAIVSIAHELNQPLTAIAANGEAARRYLGGAPPKIERARDLITWLMRDIERASDVLGNVRVLFGSACTAHELVDINLLIRETLHDLRPQMLVGGTAFDVKLARDLPPSLASPASCGRSSSIWFRTPLTPCRISRLTSACCKSPPAAMARTSS